MKLSTKGRYAVMALAVIAKFDGDSPVSLRDISLRETGSLASNLARSANAITAYLPLLDNFIFLAIYGLYTYMTILIKFKTYLKTCILTLYFDRKI